MQLRRVRARDDGGGRNGSYILNGSKTFVTNGPEADVVVVFASTAPSRGFAGVSAFLVERTTPGLSIGRPLEKMGLRTSPMSELFLESCDMPAENAPRARRGDGTRCPR